MAHRVTVFTLKFLLEYVPEFLRQNWQIEVLKNLDVTHSFSRELRPLGPISIIFLFLNSPGWVVSNAPGLTFVVITVQELWPEM